MSRKHYVIIEWPESQIIPQLPPKYFDECLATEGIYPTYAVPVKIWDRYLAGEIKIFEES